MNDNENDAKKLLVAFGILGTLVEKPFSEEEALRFLGAVVENGKKKWLALLRQQNISVREGELEYSISVLLNCIPEEKLFRDSSFAFSLRLAACFIAEKEQKGTPIFLAHLKQIFPEKLAERLWNYALDNIIKDGETGREIVPSKVLIEEHLRNRERILAHYEPQIENPRRSSQQPLHLGTDTWLVKCPGCGLEKRCDHRTKRFKCKAKACDFNQPYPFQSAS